MRRLRFVVQPSWLALHAITVAMIVTMVLLGRWQLTVSEDKGFSLQNFGYALQWWAFSVFVLGMWARALRDAYRKNAPAGLDPSGGDASAGAASAGAASGGVPEPRSIRPVQPAYRRYVMPTTTAPPQDPVHSAYNDYLAALAADDLSTDDLR